MKKTTKQPHQPKFIQIAVGASIYADDRTLLYALGDDGVVYLLTPSESGGLDWWPKRLETLPEGR